jgi:hypothetical protein
MKLLSFGRTRAFAVIAATFLLAGCFNSQPDFTPFADGMKALGICFVVCAALKALASLIRSDAKKERGGDDDA